MGKRVRDETERKNVQNNPQIHIVRDILIKRFDVDETSGTFSHDRRWQPIDIASTLGSDFSVGGGVVGEFCKERAMSRLKKRVPIENSSHNSK